MQGCIFQFFLSNLASNREASFSSFPPPSLKESCTETPKKDPSRLEDPKNENRVKKVEKVMAFRPCIWTASTCRTTRGCSSAAVSSCRWRCSGRGCEFSQRRHIQAGFPLMGYRTPRHRVIWLFSFFSSAKSVCYRRQRGDNRYIHVVSREPMCLAVALFKELKKVSLS